jgi:glycosyltransferase involved in cell wall biosynthesis
MKEPNTTSTADGLVAEQASILRQQLEAIHRDAFRWLLTTTTRLPEPFAFLHPPELHLVSVIIPAYNAAAFLERCVASVWGQQGGVRIEVLLCDDGSNDQTYPLALDLQRRSPVPMQVLTHPGRINRGVSATRNLGLRHARGAFIALLDADDAWLPQRLAVQLDYLARHPEVQCVCSFGHNRDLQGNLVPGWNDSPLAGDYRNAPEPNRAVAPYTFDDLLRTCPVVNSTLLIRREAVAAVGGYPELMAHQAEDWLLLAKLSLHAPIPLIDQPLIDYTIHPGSYSSQYFAQRLAYGVRIEFLFHLVHWMVQHPAFREQGLQLFRRSYPKLLAAHTNVGLLLEDFYQRLVPPEYTTIPLARSASEGRSSLALHAAIEEYLAKLHEELTQLRAFKRRVQDLLRPLRWIPGLQRGVQALWRFHVQAAQRRRSA